MNRIQERIKIQNQPIKQNEYDYSKNLNWRDDGDVLNDPSINDYLKGYKIDPYKFEQWANKNNINLNKEAARETREMHFFPEYLADEILTLWNGVDGPLQNLFEGFTLRYDNKMKKSIAECLLSKGYTVYPVLVDDKPRYAKRQNVIKRLASLNSNSGFKLFAGEIQDLKDNDVKVTKVDAQGLLDYYKLIYPSDYALSLVNIKIDNVSQANSEFELYNDVSLSDESLDKIEDYMSGNADPTYVKDNGFGDFNYDFLSDSRKDGVQPSDYVLKANKKKSLIKKADDIGNIPLYLVMDAVSQAARNVSILLNRNLQVPPVPIKSVRKQDETNATENASLYSFLEPVNIVKVNEIWKVYLESNEEELDSVFVIISGDFTLQGYRNGVWSNVVYNGFYTTVEEAQNEIGGYLR